MFKRTKSLSVIVNQVNSSMGIQCIAPGNCMMRHTTKCENCKNNIGRYKEKNYYEAQ